MSEESIDKNFPDEKVKENKPGKIKIVIIGSIITGLIIFVLLCVLNLIPGANANKINADYSSLKTKNDHTVLSGNREFEKEPELEHIALSDDEKLILKKKAVQDSLRQIQMHSNLYNESSFERASQIETTTPYQVHNTTPHNNMNNTNSNKLGDVRKPYKYTPSNKMKKRMDPDYQAIVRSFKSNIEQNSWQISSSEYRQLLMRQDSLKRIEVSLRNLYDGADTVRTNNKIVLGAGTRITALTDSKVNSDHPSIFTARIIRPNELAGMKLLCESGANVKGRVPCKVVKLIDKKQTEYGINGQIEMNGIVGMRGRVKNNWPKRLGPSIINTAIGGGFVAAWHSRSKDEIDSVHVDSRDAVYGPIIQQSVEGLQSEISRLGGEYPNTIEIDQGTEFSILLSSALQIDTIL